MSALQGVIHGKTIELEQEPGLPEGQRVTVEVRPLDEPPAWLERFVVDPSVQPGKFVIKGTGLLRRGSPAKLPGTDGRRRAGRPPVCASARGAETFVRRLG